jgi:hypothetical protein
MAGGSCVGLQLCKFCIGPAAACSTICRLATVQVGRVLYVSVLMSGSVRCSWRLAGQQMFE